MAMAEQKAPASRSPPLDRDLWAARPRTTAAASSRYSRFVAIMKRALPIAAGLLIAAVIAFSLMPRQTQKGISITYERMGSIQNDLAMLKPKLTGVDRKGNPFVITADAAVQQGEGVHKVTLRNVQADLTLANGRWLSATAATGFADLDRNMMKLTGGIAVFSDDGYELHTARADVDLKQGRFHGPAAVTGQGPTGTLSADSFEMDRNSNRLELNGHVKMSIVSTAVKAK